MSCLTYCKSAVRAETHYIGVLYSSIVLVVLSTRHHGCIHYTNITCERASPAAQRNQVKYSHWVWLHHRRWRASQCRDSLTAQGGGEGRKKIGLKFSLQENNTITFPSLPNHLGRISLLSHKAEYTKKQESQHMLRPLCLGHLLFTGSARQSPDFIERRRSFCSSASSSVSLESGAAVLQACYLWHTRCYAAGRSSEAGSEH